METFYIKGGNLLDGSVDISSAKNALLPILAGVVVSSGEVLIKNCNKFTDVIYMCKILEELGADNYFIGKDLYINSKNADKFCVKEEYTKKVRSSIFMLGPLLSRFRYAKVAYPGGCNIGNRPIDLHLKGLKNLNVKIFERHGYIYCDGKNMKCGEVHLDFPSVGATENIMMASVLLKGTTTIYNSAKEPEIEDLQKFLNSMGAKVSGAGTSTITIEGVEELGGTEYTPITDRIIAGTYMIACASAGGKVMLNKAVKEHNMALISKLKGSGCKIKCTKEGICVSSVGKPRSLPTIETMPFPGFPTDLQNQILTMQTISRGTSVITENLFETRFKIATELNRMGADITIKDRMAIVKGVNKLYGATVTACDLRGGAGLVIAGLCADGYTNIEDIYHIERGYADIVSDLKALNAEIQRKEAIIL